MPVYIDHMLVYFNFLAIKALVKYLTSKQLLPQTELCNASNCHTVLQEHCGAMYDQDC